MAEPRRPKVIKTRPGAARPGAARPAAETPAAKKPVPAGAAQASDAPGQAAGSVRATSSKVSVMPADPVPGDSAGADAAAVGPAAGGRTAAWRTLLTRRDRAAGRKKADKADQAPRPGAKKPPSGATVLVFPEPGYKRRRRLLAWTAAAVAAVLAVIMAVALYSPVLAVKNVVFEGNSLVATETLEATLAPLVGKPLPQVTDAQVSELLGPIVQVKSTRIQARPPSTLVVQLVERVPVALLKNGQEYVLVDQDGVQLGATADQAEASLPLIDGGRAVIGEATFQAMTAVLANLPQSILKQLANASASSPDAVELKLTDGRSVIWGSPSDMELKSQVLQALLNAPQATPEAGKAAPVPAKVFDVSAPRHPVTR